MPCRLVKFTGRPRIVRRLNVTFPNTRMYDAQGAQGKCTGYVSNDLIQCFRLNVQVVKVLHGEG